MNNSRRFRLLIATLWPGFLCAGLLTALITSVVDPSQILNQLGFVDAAALTGYSITFLVTWVISGLTSAFSVYLYTIPPVD